MVPTHHRPELLRRTVQSVVQQRYPGPIECLIVFDQEDPVRPAVDVPDGREIRMLGNDRTPGPAGCYNVGAIAARGELIALCDDDDEWLPDKLQKQVEALGANPQCAFGTCGIYLGDGDDFRRTRIPGKRILTLQDLLSSARNELHSSTFIVRTETVRNGLGLVDEAIPGSYGEDYDWLIRAARLTPIVAVTEPLVKVRWAFSYFADRWQTIIDSLQYQLERRPELRNEPRNLARIYGRMAFSYAAVGARGEGWRWARKAMRTDWREPRSYLALLVSGRLIKAETLLKWVHRTGRGI